MSEGENRKGARKGIHKNEQRKLKVFGHDSKEKKTVFFVRFFFFRFAFLIFQVERRLGKEPIIIQMEHCKSN